MNRRHLLGAAAAGLAAPGLLRAQGAFPSQPIRLIVPFAAGGPTDIPARLIADELGKLLPQRVVVENRTGAGVVVGTDLVAKAPKDGHTLLYSTIAHAVTRALFPRLPFDPLADFSQVALVGQIPMILLVSPRVPANNLRELIALFRANPGRFDYGSSGNGGAVHLASELFLSMAGGLQVNHVPYRGSSAALPDLLNGTLAMMVDVAASAIPYMQRGELRAFAISTRERFPQTPNLPTFIEQGVAGFEAYTWHMVHAPSGTPEPVITALNQALNRVMAMPSVSERLSSLTMQVVADSTPASAAAFLRAEMAKWEPIIRDRGITVG
jgi:tripartite-type tricarboxylate transporter receptor subunit TctC